MKAKTIGSEIETFALIGYPIQLSSLKCVTV